MAGKEEKMNTHTPLSIKREKTQRLVVSAMMLAIATVLALVCAYIPFLNFPFGGGLTIASMLPIVLVSYMYGIKWGLFTGGIYSIIQMLLGHGTIVAMFLPNDDAYQGVFRALVICLMDYVAAYTVIGLGGIFRKRIKNHTAALCLGAIVALSLRYLIHIVSGAIFYGAFAEWFFTDTVFADMAFSKWIMESMSGGLLAAVYSVIYNGCYMIPEIIITALAAVPIARIPFVKNKVDKILTDGQN